MESNTDIKTILLGSLKPGSRGLKPWTGQNNPDMVYLAKPREHSDAVAKEFCSGCGYKGEVKAGLLDRVFKILKSEEDWEKVDWDKKFLHWTKTCEACMRDKNSPQMMELVIDDIKR